MTSMLQPSMRLQPSAAVADTYELLIHGDIGPSWWGESVEASDVAKQLRGLKPNTALTVRINSFGGSVADGIAIYNALREHKGQKTVVVDGVAASAASLIAMAGDVIEMPETSLLMIHAPWTGARGNARDLRRTAEVLDKWTETLVSAYQRKSGKDEAAIRTLLAGDDHWYTGTEAVAEGFADKIRDFGQSDAAKASLDRAPPSVRNLAVSAYFAAATSFPIAQEKTMTIPNTETADVAPVPEVVAAAVEATVAPVAEVVEPSPQAAVLDIQARIDAAVAQAHAEAQAKIDAIQAEAAQARTRLEAEVEAREHREVVSQVTRIYANLPGKVDDIAPALRTLRKAAPDACAVVESVLASVNALLADGSKTGFEPLGNAVVEELDAEQKVQKLADAKRLENPKMTIEQARSMVYTDHPELVAQLRGEKD